MLPEEEEGQGSDNWKIRLSGTSHNGEHLGTLHVEAGYSTECMTLLSDEPWVHVVSLFFLEGNWGSIFTYTFWGSAKETLSVENFCWWSQWILNLYKDDTLPVQPCFSGMHPTELMMLQKGHHTWGASQICGHIFVWVAKIRRGRVEGHQNFIWWNKPLVPIVKSVFNCW